MWRKGNPRKIDYRIVARWLRKLDPVMTEIVLKQREEQRRKWREEKEKQVEYEHSLKDLIIIK